MDQQLIFHASYSRHRVPGSRLLVDMHSGRINDVMADADVRLNELQAVAWGLSQATPFCDLFLTSLPDRRQTATETIPAGFMDNLTAGDRDFLHLGAAMRLPHVKGNDADRGGYTLVVGSETIGINPHLEEFLAGYTRVVFDDNDRVRGSREPTNATLYVGDESDRCHVVFRLGRAQMIQPAFGTKGSRTAIVGDFLVLEAQYGGSQIRYYTSRAVRHLFDKGREVVWAQGVSLGGQIIDLSLGIPIGHMRYLVYVTLQRGDKTVAVPMGIKIAEEHVSFLPDYDRAFETDAQLGAIVRATRDTVTTVSRNQGGTPLVAFHRTSMFKPGLDAVFRASP